MNPNPLARQRRLGAAVLSLREQHGYSQAELSRRSGVSASAISRIENPFSDLSRQPDLLFVRKLLDALGVTRGSSQFIEIEHHAEVAAGGGWWDGAAYTRMGFGQRDAAIVELGALRLDEYSGLLLPGLVQTAAYARHRAGVDPDADAIVAGRMERRRQVESAEIRMVLEEQAVRRWPVPRAVMREQLLHLLQLGERPNVSIRILPVDADLGDALAPRAPYAHATYPDPNDPPIVTVDQVTRVQLVTDVVEVEGYARLHQQLRDAALSDADSAAVIRTVAESAAN